jgi:4-amino-4-deoxy-L-arabinose transferase-like glycosyltransferase
MFSINNQRKNHRYAWLLITFIALVPLWMVGMFGRGYWTPDEPREGDIAWRMSIQGDHTLPQLADVQFLEKPPLSYWLSAASIHTFGDAPAAARLPNLLYAVITTLAIGLLVYTMAGATPAAIAKIVSGSALTAYQVAIWLAPDACLVAGCAVALLGLYRGYAASTAREKFWWYLLMHIGALMGFMAKSAPGWIVPALTLLVLVAWERRWNELKRWQLWAGFILQLCVIGAWINAVWHEPQGATALRVLFWNNLAGRFTDIHATGALNYASAHKNWPGKYLVELPYYLFPWSLLIFAALHRAWSATRIAGVDGTPWRFAIAASVPFLLLLSVASTGRSIYVAPALLGFSVLVGLWVKSVGDESPSISPLVFKLALSSTRWFVCVFVFLILASLALMALSETSGICIVAAIVIAIITFIAVRRSVQQRHSLRSSLSWLYVAYAITMVIGGGALVPQIDRWQDLRQLAKLINRDAKGHTLALLQPDETTIAILDNQLRTPFIALECSHEQQLQLATYWLQLHATSGLILINLPGHASGKLTQLLSHFHRQQTDDGVLALLEQAHLVHLVARYELPQGRRYALVESVHPSPMTQTKPIEMPKS